MKLVIIESPFAQDPEKMVQYGRKCIHDSVLRDEAPIASHLLFTQPGVLDDTNSVERTLGIAAGHAWLRVAELVAFYVDFGVSNGMKLGRERAESVGIGVEIRQIGTGGLDRYADANHHAQKIYKGVAEEVQARVARNIRVEGVRLAWTGVEPIYEAIARQVERDEL